MSNSDSLQDLADDLKAHGVEPIHPLWYRALEGEMSVEEVARARRGVDSEAQIAVCSELCRPRDPQAERMLIEHAQAVAGRPATKRTVRRLVLGSGATCLAAAAVVLLMLRGSQPPAPGIIEGDVSVSSAMRHGPRPDSAEGLPVDPGGAFYLRCAAGRGELAFKIEAVRARRSGEEHRLGFPVATMEGSQELHVQADLPRGTWEVTCGVVVDRSQQFAWLDPPAAIVIK